MHDRLGLHVERSEGFVHEQNSRVVDECRRQRDTLGTLQPLTAGQAPPDQALAALQGLVERSLTPPDAAYRSYLEQLGQENCQTFAELHNSTTPAQRGKALETLKRYEQDFRILNAQKS